MVNTKDKISEKEEIEKDAKKILDNFSSKLKNISFKEEEIESDKNLRNEGFPEKTQEKFREIMISNAPIFKDNFVIAEKGGWENSS